MSRRFINQLHENLHVSEVYQITERTLRTNKHGELYLQFVLTDRTGSIDARLWNAESNILSKFENGSFVSVDGVVQRFQGTLQLIAKSLTPVAAEKLDLADFARGGVVDISRLTARVKELLAELKNPNLRNLADCFVTDEAFMQAFCNRPAGIKIHHATIGGLLEHTLKMMEMAKCIGQIYSDLLDPDLLLMGAFLHDIGKIDELSSNSGFSYTDLGQMLGHPHLGAARLREKIAETEKLTSTAFDPELAMLLTHLIISHHGTLENGSAKVPMTLEAIALYYIDSLDAKLAEFHRNLCEDVNSDSHWTNYIPGLDRKLYKNKN
ncbi:MAG: HD domain-containing protein [Thermoguttaceae bacterium]|nr:HD domain-containing protein [Thermoguttaceae bacterium]